jgi:3'-phosphoadenosine 5'-phosphosulfate (PAPS) 3'-phosphatase
VAKQVQQSLVSEDTITKKDNSPVTVGDYSVQALIIHQLSAAFPGIC